MAMSCPVDFLTIYKTEIWANKVENSMNLLCRNIFHVQFLIFFIKKIYLFYHFLKVLICPENNIS